MQHRFVTNFHPSVENYTKRYANDIEGIGCNVSLHRHKRPYHSSDSDHNETESSGGSAFMFFILIVMLGMFAYLLMDTPSRRMVRCDRC